ncbi:hypothetical protein FRIGORI9N_70011 [Frigoribacterium sp. 9N]|nr:hypothetical protein FRIGORI9N_70011 [Frigoribacterium sp. 9N]
MTPGASPHGGEPAPHPGPDPGPGRTLRPPEQGLNAEAPPCCTDRAPRCGPAPVGTPGGPNTARAPRHQDPSHDPHDPDDPRRRRPRRRRRPDGRPRGRSRASARGPRRPLVDLGHGLADHGVEPARTVVQVGRARHRRLHLARGARVDRVARVARPGLDVGPHGDDACRGLADHPLHAHHDAVPGRSVRRPRR